MGQPRTTCLVGARTDRRNVRPRPHGTCDPSSLTTLHVRWPNQPPPHQAPGDDSDEEDVGTHRYARRDTAFPSEQITKFKGRASDNAAAFLYDIKS